MSWYPVEGYSPHSMRSGCVTCGNGDVRHDGTRPELILSSGFEDEFAGVPEFCETCISEAARLIGFVSGHELSAVQASYAELLIELAEVRAQLDDKSAALRSVVHELAEATAESPEAPTKARASAR